jgi:hypothetical protein
MKPLIPSLSLVRSVSLALAMNPAGRPAVPHPTAQVPMRVAVLSVDLNNLTNSDPSAALPGRMLQLASDLRAGLASVCGYEVVAIDSTVEATAHATSGYFYEHPDVAVALARTAGAEWVIIPRVNRASPWITDLQAHVVRVRDTMLVSNRIVELKGLELDPALGERLARRGAAWMADQISQVIELSMAPGRVPPRRCPA